MVSKQHVRFLTCQISGRPMQTDHVWMKGSSISPRVLMAGLQSMFRKHMRHDNYLGGYPREYLERNYKSSPTLLHLLRRKCCPLLSQESAVPLEAILRFE